MDFELDWGFLKIFKSQFFFVQSKSFTESKIQDLFLEN